MTKEEAIAKLKAKRECIELDTNGNAELCDRNCGECKLNYEQGNMGEQKQALDLAIKALEQPTSDDCVSRAEVLAIAGDSCLNLDSYEDTKEFCDEIRNLQCVAPTFPKGATNGDMIKAIFPNIEADEIKTDTGGYIEVKYLDTTDKCDATAFRKNWWNAPYKTNKRN